MQIGVPAEIKRHEYRVALTPAGVRELCQHGHQVVVEQGAGQAVGFDDEQYEAAGAGILPDAESVFQRARLLVKVKEPQPEERRRLKPHHTLFTFLHLAPDPAQTDDLIASGATCIAYETVRGRQGGLPLLAPMSEVAGRLAVQAGASALELERGGRGVLLGGVPGAGSGEVLVIGGGTVGRNAARMAVGLGARVTVLDRSVPVLRELDSLFQGRVRTLYATAQTLAEELERHDLVIGAVLVPGAQTPRLISHDDLARMRRGAALVDVAIDQGGCAESSRPTTHDAPTYVEGGVVHYCVANMPGAVARTATQALTHATLPYVLALADQGPVHAMRADEGLAAGLSVARGELVCEAVGAAQGKVATGVSAMLDRLAQDGDGVP